MPSGRRPEGDHALTNAERQARHRARRARAQPAPPPAPRAPKPLDRRARPRRWRDAVAELIALQGQYAAWLDALPEALRDTAMAEALQAIVDLDLESLAVIEPPRGYGRD